MTLSIPDPPGPVTLGALSCPHCLLAEAARGVLAAVFQPFPEGLCSPRKTVCQALASWHLPGPVCKPEAHRTLSRCRCLAGSS